MKKPVDRTELEAQAKRLGFKLTRAGPTTQTSIRVYEESLKDFKKLVSELNLRTVDAYSDALDLFVSQTRKKLEKSK